MRELAMMLQVLPMTKSENRRSVLKKSMGLYKEICPCDSVSLSEAHGVR